VHRLTPELERLVAARPEAARHTTALVGDDDRRALLAAIMAGEREITRPRPAAPTARPGSGLKARRRRRKPRQTARVITAAGAVAALTAGATAAAGVIGAFGSGNGRQIQTAAYISRVEHALVAQSKDSPVGYSRTVLPPGTTIVPAVGSFAMEENRPGTRPLRSPLTAAVMVLWTFQNDVTVSGLTDTGQPVVAEEITVTGYRLTTVAVNYRDATWWRTTLTLKPGVQESAPPSCSPQVQNDSESWPAYISQELSCGVYHQDGRQRVDGIDAIKLTGGNGVVLWINPATYLPVRQVGPGPHANQTDFRWLPATKASLAHLKVAVPAGFRQVPPSAQPSH
jgi:hypothetical protein